MAARLTRATRKGGQHTSPLRYSPTVHDLFPGHNGMVVARSRPSEAQAWGILFTAAANVLADDCPVIKALPMKRRSDAVRRILLDALKLKGAERARVSALMRRKRGRPGRKTSRLALKNAYLRTCLEIAKAQGWTVEQLAMRLHEQNPSYRASSVEALKRKLRPSRL
jgi:hypothetical protein